MKVLYLGVYRDGTGWGSAAQDYILALDAADIEVVPRAIKLNNVDAEVPNRLLELEQNDDSDCDVVIQHILPHYMDYNGSFDKNIALYVTETSHCRNTAWPERINLMDEAWVPNQDMIQNAVASKICAPIHVIPHACDVSRYQKSYEPLDIGYIKDKFVFYYIGEVNRRKNIPALIKAFHVEFGIHEDVALVLKAHLPGKSVKDSESHLKFMCDGIKDGLKMYPNRSTYHNEVFISQRLTDEDIMRIHKTCDCFVSTSFGEAWCIPAFDAMAMGNTPICTRNGGPQDFLRGCGWLVDKRAEPCFGMTETFSEMYVGDENWDGISQSHLMSCMREAFENSKVRKQFSQAGIAKAYDYSHLAVGLQMKAVLENKDKALTATHPSTIHKHHSIRELIR